MAHTASRIRKGGALPSAGIRFIQLRLGLKSEFGTGDHFKPKTFTLTFWFRRFLVPAMGCPMVSGIFLRRNQPGFLSPQVFFWRRAC